jgi:surface protein
MSLMFADAQAFDRDISNWDTSSVIRMDQMFDNAFAFNQDISKWDTSSVIRMSAVFASAKAFNKSISNWDTSNVTYMAVMFSDAHAFNQNISNWDTSSVTNMNYMFADARAFNQNISNWDTSSVTTMNHMFFDALTFNQSLTNWCVSSNVANANFSLNSPIGLIPEFQPLWNGIGCTHKCHNGAIRNISDKTDYSCICNGDFVGLYCNHTPPTATPTTTTTTTTTPAPVIFTVPVIIGIVCGGIVLVAVLGYLVRMFVLKITTQTGYILQVVTPADL